ncbi:UDP-glucose 4-epimerase GalE [Nocardioides marmoriginsengisoli]|uniref:UDP-glucose 4-epimerase n=1 Tax=Nocardioides marmoriginsengisoli TaxID=661483 RepID=A0A3N0CL50_9ACTN|nr:UDP-glucose 4-epimerase GalE [Nocardioides marmoriginsengisoli]RNL63746.1 UDP-glucose 4-epimerase GalE [Nocardioides marmoriginsengisoli]
MSWLVTGGAGYIGSHVVRALRDVDIDAVVVDNLDTGHRRFVRDDVPFVEGDILDTDLLVRTMLDHDVHGVIHLAGFKAAGVSVDVPLVAYTQNVTGTISVLEAMTRANVGSMVFSSSAACYGTTDVDLVTEALAPAPESPYGETKLIGEWLIRDQAVATGLKHTSLRYFNVVGSGSEDLFDDSQHNLFPLIFNALLDGKTPKIYGNDYPTQDGTCVRDYVHVADLAAAHAVAARHLENGEPLEAVYNLGSGAGSSVQEIMDTVREVSGIDFEPEVIPRRPGDPPRIVADGKLAARDLDWKMRHDLRDMVATAWTSRQYAAAHPD